MKCRSADESKAILLNLCGHGHFDMQACADDFAGKLTDQSYDDADLQASTCRRGRPDGGGLLRACPCGRVPLRM